MFSKTLILLQFAFLLMCTCIAGASNIDSLKTLLNTSKEDTIKIKLLNYIYAEYIYGEPLEALKYTSKAFELAKKNSNKKEMSEQLMKTGFCYDLSNDYDKAIDYYRQSFRISEEIKNKDLMARAYLNIGVVNYFKSNYTEAISYYHKALKLREEINDKKGVGDIYINIGALHREQENMDKAAENYYLAQKIYLEIGNKSGLSTCYNNLGIVFRNKNDHEKAIEYYKKALDLRKELNDERGSSNSYNNIGFCYNSLKKHNLALEFYQKAFEIEKKFNNIREIPGSYINIGETYINLNEFSKAIEYLEKGARMSKEADNKYYLQFAYQALADVYEKTGDYKRSVDYHKLYSSIKDSVLNAEKSEQLTEMQTRFETEKKEKENQLLQAQNQVQTLEISKEKNNKYAALGAVALLLVLAFILWNRYKLKQKANLLLEKKNLEIRIQQEKLAHQKEEIEVKNKDITDSIIYAQRIQEAILPSEEEIIKGLKDHFIFYKPRDIVSGDFFWYHQANDTVFIAVADCTGHGVPGAFVSMLGNNLLNHIVIENGQDEPGKILSHLNNGIIDAFKNRKNDAAIKDGMDIAFCTINKKENVLRFSGAQRPLFFLPENELIEIKGDITPIGGRTEFGYKFKTHTIDVRGNETCYLFSDGFSDQFGGQKGKKFMSKKFKETILEITPLSMPEQKKKLCNILNDWQGNYEQVDDVLVFGFKTT